MMTMMMLIILLLLPTAPIAMLVSGSRDDLLGFSLGNGCAGEMMNDE